MVQLSNYILMKREAEKDREDLATESSDKY
jgi:hypothetical protein